MLTGIPSPENGVRDYFCPLPATARTIAHRLNERGYATAFFGKWHLAQRDPAALLVGEEHAKTLVLPEGRGGFGFWEGFESGFLLNDPWLHGTRLPEPTQFEGYQSDILGERAAGWIAAQRPAIADGGWRMADLEAPAKTQADLRHQSAIRNSQSAMDPSPWFVCVSLEAPHPPYNAPAAGVATRDPRDIVLLPNVPSGEAGARARTELAGYYAHIEATDRALGRLLTTVDPAGEALVIFTSVHGDMHGAHGLFRKGWPYEESVRIPLLVRRPASCAAVGPNDAPISLVDLPELILAEVGNGKAKQPDFFARISMPVAIPLPDQCDRVWRGLRTKTRKLVLNHDGSPWLLFDLERDPFEMSNLAGDPGWSEEMKELQTWLKAEPSG